jgi:hypothetical protein
MSSLAACPFNASIVAGNHRDGMSMSVMDAAGRSTVGDSA